MKTKGVKKKGGLVGKEIFFFQSSFIGSQRVVQGLSPTIRPMTEEAFDRNDVVGSRKRFREANRKLHSESMLD
jgi:hypothetical protein